AHQVHVGRAVRRGLRVAYGEGSVRGDLAGQLPGGVQGLALGDYAVDEPDLARLLGADAAAGEDELLGERRADQARGARGGAPAGEDAEAHLGEAEGRVRGCNAYITGYGHLAATAEGVAIHGGYSGDGAPI